jgi:hypothetical protein
MGVRTMIVGITQGDRILFSRGFIELSTIEQALKQKYEVNEITLPFDLRDGFILREVIKSNEKNKRISYQIFDEKIKVITATLYFKETNNILTEASEKEALVLKKYCEFENKEGKFVFNIEEQDLQVLQAFSLSENLFDAYKVAQNNSILLKKFFKTEDVKEIRKIAEENAFVLFKYKKIKADDKAISMLSTYINTNMENVVWKCENDEWLLLNKTDMIYILNEISQIKKSLFEKEFQGGE